MVWWAWMLLGFVLWRLMSRRRWARYYMKHGMHGGMHQWGFHRMYPRGRGRCGMVMMGGVDMRNQPAPPPEPVVELSPAQKREREMADLRKRYVADEITVEEYEAGLDRILKGD